MGRELPTGTVTLLFSDIESSTRMVHALGDDWARVLEQQRRLARRAWERHGGVEMGTEGDSFFVVFASPRDAVAAGLRVQASMAAASWPEGARVRVRIGIHTGTPARHADGYVGMDVHRAARVAAAAHGGQLLVSDATLRLVADGLPDSVTSKDLGEHRLKDIPTRTRLHQLSPAGQDADFPPPRTLGGAGSLPTSLRDGLRDVVGREEEVARTAADVDDGARLLTLTGPGGVGKTTLAGAVAARVADRFADGAFVVPLVGVTTGEGMWAAMSQVLDLPPDGQVPPAFFDHLGDRRVLVVLDNLEQIADADAVVRTLLERAPHVVVLATSRRALHVAGERERPVDALSLPDAVALFSRQAARARPGFVVDERNRDDVEALCTALDRLPLALEIAAARVRVLSPAAVLTRIDRTLDLTSADRSRSDRQATLRGAIAWSYDLLPAPSRRVLDHLGVFVGGASLEAVAAVVGEDTGEDDVLDVLFELVGESMVVADDTADGEPRFHLLETVRRFALDRLAETGGLAAAQVRHAQQLLGLVPDLRRRLRRSVGDYRAARETFLRELSNLDAMVQRGVSGTLWDGTPVPPAHLGAIVADLAVDCRLAEDTRQWVAVALDQDPDPLARTWLACLGARAAAHVDDRRALDLASHALARLDVLGTSDDTPWVSAAQVGVEAAHVATRVTANAGDLDAAQAWHARLGELAALSADPMNLAGAAELGSMLALFSDDLDTAWRLQLETEQHRRAAGLELDLNTSNNLAHFEVQRGRPDLGHARLASRLPALLEQADPAMMVTWAETLAATVAHAHPLLCARAFATASVFRVVEGLGNDEYGAEDDEETMAAVRPLVTPEEWERAWQQGLGEPITDLLQELADAPVPPTEQEVDEQRLEGRGCMPDMS